MKFTILAPYSSNINLKIVNYPIWLFTLFNNPNDRPILRTRRHPTLLSFVAVPRLTIKLIIAPFQHPIPLEYRQYAIPKLSRTAIAAKRPAQ
jgi:hypothetical protein